jgi:hypothetical protein
MSHPYKIYQGSWLTVRGLGVWDVRYIVAEIEKDTLLRRVKATIADSEAASYVRTDDVKPRRVLRHPSHLFHSYLADLTWYRPKDGGAFVHLSFDRPAPSVEAEDVPKEDAGESDSVLEDIESKIRQQVSVRDYRPWYMWGESQVFLVKVGRRSLSK